MKGSTRSKLVKLVEVLQNERMLRKGVERRSIKEKEAIVAEIKRLVSSHRAIGLINMEGVPSRELSNIKEVLSKYGVIRVFNNTLVARALNELRPRGVEEFINYLTGSNMLIFTDLNAFTLANLVDRVVMLRYIKPGEKAPSDIYVPEGPTGIPPGPMMSVFGKLKLRTMVKEGVIWIAKESKVASAGDVVSPELASLLRKLEIKAYPVKLSLKVVWDEGVVIPKDKLRLDVESFRNELLSAVHTGRTLALETALPLPEVMPEVISRAYLRAVRLAGEAGYVTPETAPLVLRSAAGVAQALAGILMQRNPELNLPVAPQTVAVEATPTSQKPSEEEGKPEEEGEEKKVSEEEIAEGISSLFG
ncbi:MAG: 50S ribosomal protein L10 [Zestosphaera sp.]